MAESLGRPRHDHELAMGLRRMIAARLVAVTILLGSYAFMWRAGQAALYAIIGGTYLLSIGYGLWVVSRRSLRTLAYVQAAGDILAITALIQYTGGIDSVFVMLYGVAIAAASGGVRMRGCLILGLAASAVYAGLIAFHWHVGGALAAAGAGEAVGATVRDAALVVYLVSMRAAVVLMIALLSGYASERAETHGHELRRLRVFTDDILSNMTSGLATVDGDGSVTYLNPAGEELLGESPGAAIGRPLLQLLGGRAARELSLRALVEMSGDGLDHEVEAEPTAGIRLTLGYSTSLILTPDVEQPGVIFMFKDLSRIREMEERLKEADRLAVMGRLAATIAHEVRNPLASLTGSVELLHEGLCVDGEERRLMDLIIRESERIDGIVGEFLDFAAERPLEISPCDLGAIVGDVATLVSAGPAGAAGVELSTEIADDLPPVPCDEAKMKQVLFNLCTNGVEAMPDGGRLSIRVTRDRRGGPARWVRLDVADTGPGIDESVCDEIYDPFFTTKARGSGLGLAVARNIVQRHGGTITFTSRPGAGTTFQLRLPVGCIRDRGGESFPEEAAAAAASGR